MSEITLLTVDGIALKNPSSYDINFSDMDSSNSYTSETGVLNRDMIRGNQRTIDVAWTMLNLSELRTILSCISSDSELKPSFMLHYYDIYSGTFKTEKFYATDRKTNSKRIKSTINGMYTLSFSFVQF